MVNDKYFKCCSHSSDQHPFSTYEEIISEVIPNAAQLEETKFQKPKVTYENG